MATTEDRTKFAGLVALIRRQHPRESVEQSIERAREVDPALYSRVTGQPPAPKADPYGLLELFGRKFEAEWRAERQAKREQAAELERRTREAQAKVQAVEAEREVIEQKLAWNEGERLLRGAAVDIGDERGREVQGTPHVILVDSSRAELEAGDVEACRAPLTRDAAVARLKRAEAKRAAALLPEYR